MECIQTLSFLSVHVLILNPEGPLLGLFASGKSCFESRMIHIVLLLRLFASRRVCFAPTRGNEHRDVNNVH